MGLYTRLLILDEPDSHLHPDNQRKLARLLNELVHASEFQVLISTHSRHFLDEFANLNARVHWFSSGQIQPDNNDRVSALLNLGALDAGDRLRNGATPFIVLSEDKKSAALKKILSASGLGDDKCEVWSYAGCTNESAALILAQFIREHAPATQIVVHRDRDYLSEEAVASYTQCMEAAGLKVFVTVGTDIESHLLNPEHLATIAHPLTVERLAQIVDQATELAATVSVEKFNNSRVSTALKQRNKNGGGEINYGQMAAAVQTEYTANPIRFRHGKSVLGHAIGIIQQELGRNIQVAQGSEFLRVPLLEDIAAAHEN